MFTRRGPVVFGLDPSSKKLALVVTDGHSHDFHVAKLPDGPDHRPEACVGAEDWIRHMIGVYPDVALIGLEMPMGAKGGFGSTIPQAMISGALQAGIAREKKHVELINIPNWKLSVVGKGSASKEEISNWVEDNYPSAWLRCVDSKGKLDQDLVDAFCIAQKTAKLEKVYRILATRSELANHHQKATHRRR